MVKYAMVFDAGSSKTRMFIYKWEADKVDGTGVVSEVYSCKMSGGVAKVLRHNASGKTSEYLEPCLEDGLSLIPEDRRGHSPLFLAATAGMRLLRIEDPSAAQQILGNLSLVLERTGLLFSTSSVRIISGQEEAVAGWISANYLLHTIYPVKKNASVVGMLDLGGASTQITFLHSFGNVTSEDDVSVQLYGSRHELLARSYLCYGMTEAFNRYQALLTETGSLEGNESIRVMSPCHNYGFNQMLNYDEYISSCSKTQSSSKLQNVTVNLTGTGDPEQCATLTRSLLDSQYCTENFVSQECFDAPSSHSPKTHFIAVSGFWTVMKSLKLENQSSSVGDFTQAVHDKCSMSWDDFQNQTDFDPEYGSEECFQGYYQAALLLHGYKIQNTTWENIDFIDEVDNMSIGWTLGFTIWSTNAFPAEASERSLPVAIFAVSSSALAFVMGGCVSLLVLLLLKFRCFKHNRVGSGH